MVALFIASLAESRCPPMQGVALSETIFRGKMLFPIQSPQTWG